METKKKNRTDLDFSKHELTVIKHDDVLIHRLFKPGTSWDSFIFINTQGVMTVTGDYYNWVFCREFHPSSDGHVSDGYWAEKLRISSDMESHEFDSEATKEQIKSSLKHLKTYKNNYDSESYNEIKEYYKMLLGVVECSNFEYEFAAYNDYPSDLDTESIPYCKKIKPQLLYVFDAFEEICSRLTDDK